MLRNPLNCDDFFPLDPIECEVFSHEDAENKLTELGFPPSSVFMSSLDIADNNFELCLKMNDTRFIARYGYFKQEIGIQINNHNDWEIRPVGSQRCLVSDKYRKIILIAAGNDHIGHIKGNINTGTYKGVKTKEKILANTLNYKDTSNYQTWMLLYPSRLNAEYFKDERNLKVELVHFVGCTTKIISGSEKFKPEHPTCRIILEGRLDLPLKQHSNKPKQEKSGKITEDDFPISLKTG